MSDGAARIGNLNKAIDRACVPDGALVTVVRGTSGPRDGVSMFSWNSLVEVVSCRGGEQIRMGRHAGRDVIRSV
jgi:hypothetical protein